MPQIGKDRSGELHVPGELVVAGPHLELVTDELTRLTVPHDVIDTSPELDLALVQIPAVAEVAARVAPSPDTNAVQAANFATEQIVDKVRQSFMDRFDEWAPVVHKNHIGEGVHGAPDIGIGGVGPSASRPPAAVDSLPPLTLERETVQVGILDTALYAHPGLNGTYVVDDTSALNVGPEPRCYLTGHATFVAGLVMRSAPNARLRVCGVLEDDGVASAWNVAKAIVALSGSPVQILNLSFCCFTTTGLPPFALARALERLDHDVVVVAAAGNHGNIGRLTQNLSSESAAWPAAFDRVIAVGATDDAGTVAEFSPRLPWMRLMAPGKEVTSTYLQGRVTVPVTPENETGSAVDRASQPPTLATEDQEFDGYATWSGTSFAAAAVTGAIARRVRPGVTAREAAAEVLRLTRADGERIWAYKHPGQ